MLTDANKLILTGGPTIVVSHHLGIQRGPDGPSKAQVKKHVIMLIEHHQNIKKTNINFNEMAFEIIQTPFKLLSLFGLNCHIW